MDLSNAVWRKVTRSKEDGSNCVEVTFVLDIVAFRDSKDPHGPKLVVSRTEFRRFADSLKDM